MREAILWTVALLAVPSLFAVGLGWWSRRAFYQAGRRAHRDGLPMGSRWPRRMKEGWSDAWGDRLRGHLGYRGPRR